MRTIALPESVVFDLVQAADRWLDELHEYIIPSTYESSDQDGDNYQAEADESREAINTARRALGIEVIKFTRHPGGVITQHRVKGYRA